MTFKGQCKLLLVHCVSKNASTLAGCGP